MGKTPQDVECGSRIIDRCEDEMEESKTKISYKELSKKAAGISSSYNLIPQQVSQEVSLKELLSKKTKKEALI